MTCDFSFRHYRECCSKIAERSSSGIEMIHDIDYAPDNVLTMSAIEHEYGIRSTYFVRLHARTYNPFALPYYTMLRTMAQDFGHQIGLHFEPSFYQKEEMRDALNAEVTALSRLLGITVTSFSIHEPARFGSLEPEMIPEHLRYYCWNAPYYEGKKYLSDSGVRWREGCMCEHFHRENLIILTHPDHWYQETSAENY